MSPLVAGLAGSVTVTGQATLDAYPGLERRLGDRAVVTFPAADLAAFAAGPQNRQRARAELGLSDRQLVIGTVGNRNPRKGHDVLIETAAYLSQANPDVRVLVLGGHSPAHARYEAALHSRVDQLGLGRVVRFVDPGPRVPELLPGLDIFVLPSHPGEGMPTVILEAMACGLPVVATDVAAVREAVVPESTGLLVPPRDVAALGRALTSLAGDEARRREMGQHGRDRVNRQFTVERAVADRLRAWELALRASGRRACP
jgi:glycosyltransferase involved in cell wall biosynthesis